MKDDLSQDMFILRRENNPCRRFGVTFSCLGKLNSVNQTILTKWQGRLQTLLNPNVMDKNPLIIGLTESGIVLSGLVHQLLVEQSQPSAWICSTRRPVDGLTFMEHHSHGPQHCLILPDQPPGEIWFVEDEISTGQTLLHLSLLLAKKFFIKKILFFAVIDFRSNHDHLRFEQILQAHEISYSTHVLTHTPAPDPLQVVQDQPYKFEQIGLPQSKWLLPELRPALGVQHEILNDFIPALSGTLLVIGEAVDLALLLVRNNPELSFRHITLSPWEIDGNHIFTRMDFQQKYFLYNYHDLKSPLHLLYDPVDREIAAVVLALMSKQGYAIEPLQVKC